jgi:hypothetical protein
MTIADQLKQKQEAAYDAMVKANWEGPMHAAARVEYDNCVIALRKELGDDVHCMDVDFELFEFYGHLFKDENGIKPRFHMTYLETKASLEAIYERQKYPCEPQLCLHPQPRQLTAIELAFRQAMAS